MSALEIEFYTRPGCHLCEEALKVLRDLQRQFDFQIHIRDISDSAPLEKRYGHDIPVATLGGRKILKYRADEKMLRRILSRHARD